jgi:hypothetical protein
MYGIGYQYGGFGPYGTQHQIVLRENGSTYTQFGMAGNMHLIGSGNATGDFRAPVFYDNADTTFRLDLNSSSRLRNLYVGDGGSDWSDPGGWGTQLHVSNGPHSILRLYARSEGIETGMFSHVGGLSKGGSFTNHDFRIVRNFSDRMVFYSGYTFSEGYIQAASSLRAPIFYDSDNTAYYVDPNGGSRVRGPFDIDDGHGGTRIRLTANGSEMGTGVPSYLQMWVSEPGVTWNDAGFGYNVHNDGGSPSGFGRINTGQGQAYMRFNTTGNTYFYNTNTGGTRYSTMEWYSNGTVYANDYLSGGNSLRAPIFYDSNDTTYYGDFNGQSRISSINMGYQGGQVYTAAGQGILFFNGHGESDIQGYSIGTTMENYNGNYTKLTLDWHTGIKIGAAFNYGGIRFYNNSIKYYGGSQLFSIGEGDQHVRVNNILFAGQDVRTPIYYDSNTAYYFNGDGTSNFYAITDYVRRGAFNLGRMLTTRRDIVGDQDYWTGTWGWGTSYGNWDSAWQSGFGAWDIWGTGTGHPQGGGYIHAQGIVSGQHYATAGGGSAYGWMMVGSHNATENRYWARGKWGGGLSGWKEFAMYGGGGSGDLRANVFYDSDDTTYYLDPNAVSNTGLRIRGGALHGPNWTWGAYLYVGTNGRPDGTASVCATNGNLHLDCQNGYETYINHYSGNRTYTYELRSTFIYDYNNTGYYLNPDSYSQFSSGEFNDYVRAARHDMTGVGGNSGQGAHAYSIFQEGGGWGYPFPDLRIAYHTGIKMGANAGSYEGIRIYDDYPMSSLLIQLSGSSNYSFWYTWQNLTGHHGMYSGINGAHIYPSNRSYGSWIIDGNRNGWYGLSIGTGNSPYYMFDGSGNGGCYIEGYGRWVFYHSLGNNCMGVGTSTTSGSYRMYVAGGIYAEGNIVGFSDRRKKENIKTVGNALNIINKLRGVYYTTLNDIEQKRQVGVIAQEVEEVLPEVVTYAADVDEYGVDYGKFAGVFIEAIKEQQTIINTQANEIDLLKEELQKIKDLIFNINKG